MSEIIDSLRRVVETTVEAMDLLDLGYATVESISPLSLSIKKTNLKVTEPVAVMSDNVRYRSVNVQGQRVVINPGLSVGDKVIFLKANAGQNYVVISKV
ncbi:DUF2577 family protein [Enterocloster bolteae]|jgi:hypothetical protein|uniref:DUF2577 domain-containing protein n=1 Tax=Enterocloster bolteae TaxID=208479 RepID=A0A412YTW8_9FIRM|nr:DUF2577 family protein [Enterocloster bolteae]RGV69168.1 DUF2577 domain-containing protein [Enterocloster bolteae]DAY65592.1 MAG TPA: Protein of unknown function (DUF2577) [Caudoviricetes sp.]